MQSQQELIERNLDLVRKVIGRYIRPNESIIGMGYEDLYQEGCVALCKAAAQYNGKASFAAFAGMLIRNHLIDVCRSAAARYAHEGPAEDAEALRDKLENIRGPDETEELDFTPQEAAKLLTQAKQGRGEFEQAGITAVWLKMWGYTTPEIGRALGLNENQVGKRLTKAREILRQDPAILRAVKTN